MNHERWWKEPLMRSIQFHREQLQKLKEHTKNNKALNSLGKLESRLEQLEVTLQSSSINPHLLHYFQSKLAHFQKRLLDWQEHEVERETESISIAETQSEHHHQDGEGADRYPSGRVPIGKHRLPPLPYDYNALEPYIDERTMRLHHDIHHKSYVENLNKAELMMRKARRTGNYQLLKHWEREAAFNGAGHYLHTIFWYVMSPEGGGKPSGSLLQQIDRDFGSFAHFKKQFSEAAAQVEGSGWAILVWSPRPHRLEILQAEKHQNLSQWDVIPLLVLDVWEHAYYLKYLNKRKVYIQNWWNVVNWSEVQKRYDVAKEVRWKPY